MSDKTATVYPGWIATSEGHMLTAEHWRHFDRVHRCGCEHDTAVLFNGGPPELVTCERCRAALDDFATAER
jgi:hypothetical protein